MKWHWKYAFLYISSIQFEPIVGHTTLLYAKGVHIRYESDNNNFVERYWDYTYKYWKMFHTRRIDKRRKELLFIGWFSFPRVIDEVIKPRERTSLPTFWKIGWRIIISPMPIIIHDHSMALYKLSRMKKFNRNIWLSFINNILSKLMH